MVPKRTKDGGLLNRKNLLNLLGYLSMVPKRTLWAVDRHTLNILV